MASKGLSVLAASLFFLAQGTRINTLGVQRVELEVASNESAGSEPIRIRALFQNPHWECFLRDSSRKCKDGHHGLFEGFMKKYDMDFAGLAMGGPWQAPSGYEMKYHKSGPEEHHLAWHVGKWDLEKYIRTEFRGGRAAILARFHSKKNPKVKVVVASMHYPHDKTGVVRISKQIAELTKGHTENVLFLADTNVDDNQKCDSLTKELRVKGHVRHTNYDKTCCADSKFAWAFDRIWSNFGDNFRTIDDESYMSLTNNRKHTPHWAKGAKHPRGGIAAYHHPVMAELFVSA